MDKKSNAAGTGRPFDLPGAEAFLQYVWFVPLLQDDIRDEAIAALDDLMGEQGQQGLADLMTSLGISKPLNTKEERVSTQHVKLYVFTFSKNDFPCVCIGQQRLVNCMLLFFFPHFHQN